MVWSDGAFYQGQWVEGKAQGLGKFHHINGDYYLGQWRNDKANGWGFFKKVAEKTLKKGEAIL